MKRLALIPFLLFLGLAGPVMQLEAQQSPTSDAKPCSADGQAASTDPASEKKAKNGSPATQPANQPCEPTQEPSAAQKFPFPGSTAAPPLPGSPEPAANAPSPSPSQHPPSASEEHPFPGNAPPMPGSGSSSSNDGGYSGSNDGSSSADTPSGSAPEEPTKPADLGRRRLPKVKNLQSNEERVDEDLRVAKFYEDKGDLNAAYLRLRDAVKCLPNESESHFSLARLAQKLDKRDEAISEYSTYLKLEPDGENIKQARRALDQLAKK